MIKIYEVYYDFYHGDEHDSFWLSKRRAEKRAAELNSSYVKIEESELEDSEDFVVVRKII